MDSLSKKVGHKQRNMELLKAFIEKKVNLDEPRSIDLHFWAWGQPNSVQLAHELYQKGLLILNLSPAYIDSDPERWNIEAGTKLSIAKVVDEVFTGELVDLAARFDANYDGWGTSV